MEYRRVAVLGDSILKGIQVEQDTGKYVTLNNIDVPALESRFGLQIQNNSHFGATVDKGKKIFERLLKRTSDYDYVIMDFGGNDCNHCWDQIAADPEGEHTPNVPLNEFIERYRNLIRAVKGAGIEPVLTTLPPLVSQRFFDWWCNGLDKSAVLRWLGDVNNIYSWQENYSRAIERLAYQENVRLVDVRGAFLDHGHIEDLLCVDGTHPNSAGQALITNAFYSFAEQRESLHPAV